MNSDRYFVKLLKIIFHYQKITKTPAFSISPRLYSDWIIKSTKHGRTLVWQQSINKN